MTTNDLAAPSGAGLASDREQIVELYTRLGAAIDACDWKAWGGLLTEDVVVDWAQWGPDQGRERVIEQMATMNERHASSHRMVTNHRVRVDGDRATAIAHYRSSHINASDKVSHSHEGWYLAKLVRTVEGWQFSWIRRVDLKHVLLDTPEGRALATELIHWA